MQKGDLRKKQILETAEKLFCQKGYEKTSVQDILDILHLSKGSFYHHYESKEFLLSCICEKRAGISAESLSHAEHRKTGIAGVEQVLSSMIPFNGDGLQFLSMILPVFLLPEGRSIRECYQDALKQFFYPLLLDSFDSALVRHEIYCEDPEFTARICMDLTNDMWSSISEQMIHMTMDTEKPADKGELLTLLEQYRSALEKILTAPFGSLHLIGLEDLENLSREIRQSLASFSIQSDQ